MKESNTLKNKLRIEQDLPEDLSWAAMKEGIYDQMAKSTDEVPVRKDNTITWIALLGFSALLIGVLAVCILLVDHPEDTKEIKKDQEYIVVHNKNAVIDSPKTLQYDTTIDKKQSTVSLSTESANHSTERSVQSSQQHAHVQQAEEPIAHGDITITKHSSKNYEYLASTSNNLAYNKKEYDSKPTVTDQDNRLVNGNNVLSEEHQINASLVNINKLNPSSIDLIADNRIIDHKLALLPRLKTNLLNHDYSPLSDFSLTALNVIEANHTKPKFSVELGIGVTYGLTNLGFVEHRSLVNSTESLEAGYVASLRVNRAVPKQFYVSTGIELRNNYRQQNGALKFNTIVDSTLLTQIVDNQLRTTEIYTDTVILTSDIVDFELNNSVRTLSIPIVLGYNNAINSFYYFGGVGINFAFNNQHVQKNIVQNESALGYEIAESRFNTNLALGILGELGFGYEFKNNIRLGTRMSYLMKTKSFGLEATNGANISSISAQINLGYGF